MKKAVRILCILLLFCAILTSCDDNVSDALGEAVGDPVVDPVVTLSPLAVTTNVWIEDGYLYWNPVEGAKDYTVSVDGRDTICAETKLSLEGVANGDHTFNVKANADGTTHQSSAFTEPWTVKLTDGAITQTGTYAQFGDLSESYLGYGFDVIRSSVFSDKYVKLSSPLFKTEELMKQRLLRVDSKYSYVDEVESSSMSEFMSKWNANANVSVSWGGKKVGGSVELSAKYSNTNEKVKSIVYQCVSITNQQFYIVMQSDLAAYRNMMTDSFKADLYSDMSPATFFDRYGTHFITSAVMGGKINSYYMHTSETEQSLSKASAKAAVEVRAWKAKTEVDTSVSWREEMTNEGIEIKNTLEVIGGGDFAMLNAQDVPDNYAEWEKSLNEEASLIGIKDTGSLWAIWELIDPSLDTKTYTWEDENGVTQQGTRAQQLQAYFYQYGVESYNDLMEASGLPEIIVPTDIENILVNGSAAQNGEYTAFAGISNDITFTVLPQNAIGYTKVVALATPCDYARINENNQLEIDANLEQETLLTLTLSAGSVRKQIQVRVRPTYRVDFRPRYQGENLEITVLAQTGIPLADYVKKPTLPETPGWVFLGWSTDPAGENMWDFFSDYVTGNLILYGNWEAIKPVVTFDTGDGSAVEPQTLIYNGTATKPKNPTLTGYTFGGWYTDEDYTQAFDFSSAITENITLYAKWVRIEYTVTFVTNGGTPVAPATTSIVNGYNITAPNTVKQYYVLDGWYQDEALLSRFYFESKITADMTLYAKWVPARATVNFVDTDGTSAVYDELGAKIAARTTDIEKQFKITAPVPAKEGHTFVGWYLDGIPVDLANYSEFKPREEDYTLVARWSVNSYTVTFIVDGEEYAVDSYEYGAEISYPVLDTNEYAFSGWKYGIKDLPTTMPAKNITVTGTLSAKIYAITYYVDGNFYKTVNLAYGSAITLIDEPTAEGKTFSGWICSTVNQLPATMPAHDLRMDGRYVTNGYVITFETDGGNKIVPILQNYGTTITAPADPTKAGYTFVGWDREIPVAMPAENMTITAQWVANTYTVLFDANGGSGSMENQTRTYDDALNLIGNKFSKEGYAFVGWSTTPDGSGNWYTDNSTENLTAVNGETVILYAQWSNGGYIIAYDPNGGDGSMQAQEHTYDQAKALSKNTFSKLGYTFDGWNTVADGSGTGYVDEQSVSNLATTGMITLYAQWKPNTYTIQFNANGGDGSMQDQEHTYDQAKALSKNTFSKLGYTLDGWNTAADGSGTHFDDEQVVTNLATEGLIVLYAQWTTTTYTIQFATNSDTSTGDISYTIHNANSITLPIIKYSGNYADYINFLGWYEDTALTKAFAYDLLANPRSLTLYAKWDTYKVFGSIDETPWCPPGGEGKIIFDWSNESITDLNDASHQRPLPDWAINRPSDMDIYGYDNVTDIYFIGDPQKTYYNFNMTLAQFQEGQALTIHFVDFNFVCSANAINAISAAGIDLTLDITGTCSIATATPGVTILNMPDTDLKFTGSGSLSIYGSNGLSGSGNGGDGGTAIIAADITVDMTGSLNVYGGNGGNGEDGSKGTTTSNGGNGKNGGDGGTAIICQSLSMINPNAMVCIIGGNGGNGGKGGDIPDGSNNNGMYNIADAGNGGNGGNGGIPILVSSLNGLACSSLELKYGNGGNGGDGGEGGDPKVLNNDYDPDQLSHGGNGGDGGSGFTAGNGGNGGQGGGSYGTDRWTTSSGELWGTSGDGGDGGDGGNIICGILYTSDGAQMLQTDTDCGNGGNYGKAGPILDQGEEEHGKSGSKGSVGKDGMIDSSYYAEFVALIG